MAIARTTDPETSKLAAESVGNLNETKKVILQLLAKPMGDEELVNKYEFLADNQMAPWASQSGIRSRRSELVEDGYLFDSGERIKTKSNRSAIVWMLTITGQDWIENA